MKHGSSEWYLYHAIENETPVVPLILLSCFLLICKGGFFAIIIVWLCYFAWASSNNERLNHDPEIIKQREAYNELRRKGLIE